MPYLYAGFACNPPKISTPHNRTVSAENIDQERLIRVLLFNWNIAGSNEFVSFCMAPGQRSTKFAENIRW